jgi:hypothetical protein
MPDTSSVRQETRAHMPPTTAGHQDDTSDLSRFIKALFGARDDDTAVRLSYVEEDEHEALTPADAERIAREAEAEGEPLYAFAGMSDGLVSFVYEVMPETTAKVAESLTPEPTVALYNAGTAILVYAIDTPALPTDVAGVRARGFDLNEPIPTPGSNGWPMVHCNPDAYHTVQALKDAFSDDTGQTPAGTSEAATDADLGTYGDATVKAPFNDADPAYAQMMTISVGGNSQSTNWKPQTMPVGQFVALLCRHPENSKKDGTAFVLAEIAGAQRRKVAVKACYGVGLDIDVGTSGTKIDAELAKLGCLAVRYTTHSHGKARTEIRKDRLIKAADKAGRDLDDAFILDFLRDEEHWDPALLDSVEYVGDEHQPEGLMALLNHAQMPKHRRGRAVRRTLRHGRSRQDPGRGDAAVDPGAQGPGPRARRPAPGQERRRSVATFLFPPSRQG